MKQSRKVLEAEKKRAATSGACSISSMDGYLRDDSVFPHDRSYRASPLRRTGAHREETRGNATERGDTGVNDDGGRHTNGGADGAGAEDHRHHLDSDTSSHFTRQTHKRQVNSPRSLSTSPTPKKHCSERTSPSANDTNGLTARTATSLGVRGNLFAADRKRSTARESPNAHVALRYAAPTVSSQMKERSPRGTTPKRLGLHILPPQRMCRRAVTANIVPAKAGRRQMATVPGTGNDKRGTGLSRDASSDQALSKPVSFLSSKPGTTATDRTTTPPKPSTTSAVLSSLPLALPEAAQTTSMTPEPRISPSPPFRPATSPPFPPLRAAVSPRTHACRQHRLSTGSPSSNSRTPPTCIDAGPCATQIWLTPPTGPSCSPAVTGSAPLSPLPVKDGSSEVSSPAASKTSRSGRVVREPVHSRMTKYDSYQFSGFINRSNDCYACSVLTLLLRNNLFCRAMFNLVLTDTAYNTISAINNTCSRNNYVNNNNNSDGFDRSTSSRAISSHSSYKYAFPSVHQVMLYFARLLQKPEAIRSGVDLGPLQGFFSTNFFSGEQEDAHEFFLALIAKLEEECIGVNGAGGKKTERSDGVVPLVEAGNDVLFAEDNAQEAEQHGQDGPVICPERVWINRLIRGKLLNIIRCGNAGCKHEIVTEDVFINLSLDLVKMTSTESPASSALPQQSSVGGGVMSGTNVDSRSCTPVKNISKAAGSHGSLADRLQASGCCDVQTLLNHTLRFATLDTYVCDACGSSQRQRQGGCLLGVAPPLLVLQLKRFATTHDAVTGGIHVSKDKSPVCVNDELTIYALRGEGQYDTEKKQLSPCVRGAERAAKQGRGGPTQQRVSAQKKAERTQLNQHVEGKPHGVCADANDRQSPQQLTEMRGKEDAHEAVDDTHVNAIRYRYRLQGLVLHIGSSPLAGHYVAEFSAAAAAGVDATDTSGSPQSQSVRGAAGDGERTNTSRWRLADDVHVSALSSEDVVRRRSCSTDCYLLLYEKVEEEEVMCPVWRVLPSDAE